jgi:hypothetical protein
LNWVAATRHAIIHYNGKAYKYFEKLTAKHPFLSKLKAGDPIPIEGDLVGEFVAVAIAKGMALVDFVDRWIKNNAR